MAEKFIKVQKRTAEKLYDKGKKIYLIPSNVRLGNPWIEPIEIKIDINDLRTFNSKIDSFEIYNCNNELGRYTHFYIKEEE